MLLAKQNWKQISPEYLIAFCERKNKNNIPCFNKLFHWIFESVKLIMVIFKLNASILTIVINNYFINIFDKSLKFTYVQKYLIFILYIWPRTC